jgi:hypothetical protein
VRESIVEPKDWREYYAGLGIELPEEAPGGMMPGTTEHSRCLTDGKNFMWVEISNRGFVADITRYGGNDPNDILWAIDQEFEAGLIDEEHPDYWEGREGEVVAVPLEDFECSRNHQGTSCQTIAPCADKRHPRAHPFTPVIRVDLVVVGPTSGLPLAADF